jgi:hypothetical protein
MAPRERAGKMGSGLRYASGILPWGRSVLDSAGLIRAGRAGAADHGAGDAIRTRDIFLGKEVLYP